MRGVVPGKVPYLGMMYRALMVLALGLATLCSRSATAGDFFASSPGPLANSHAALDVQDHCNDCHVDGSKEVDNNKCLNCHDHNDLKARIASGKGYHASNNVKGKDCKTCHLDHKGRGYDIMGWKSVAGGEKGFN